MASEIIDVLFSSDIFVILLFIVSVSFFLILIYGIKFT